MTRPLKLHTEGLVPPPDRGRLMSAVEVAAQHFPKGTSPRFVQRHVYPRVPIGRRTFWFEKDVLDWLDSQRIEHAS